MGTEAGDVAGEVGRAQMACNLIGQGGALYSIFYFYLILSAVEHPWRFLTIEGF